MYIHEIYKFYIRVIWCCGIIDQVFFFFYIYFIESIHVLNLLKIGFLLCLSNSAFLSSLILSVLHHYK